MNYKYIKQQQELDSLLPTLMAGRSWAIDTETTGLDPIADKVILVQIGNSQVQYILDARTVSLEPLRVFFEDERITKFGHNLKFDYKMIKSNFKIEVEGLRDTYVAEKLLHMGRKFSGYGLDDITNQYLGITMDKEVRKTFGKGYVPEGDFSEEQLIYSAKDIEYIPAIFQKQSELLSRNNMMSLWVIECDAIACFADMELGGVRIHQENWKKLMDENQKAADELEEAMNEIAKSVVQSDIFGDVYVNWRSPPQVVKILQAFQIKVKKRGPGGSITEELISSSDDKALKQIKNIPLIQMLKKYRGHMVRVSTFGQPYLDAIRPETGRFHPEIDQLGTDTGRPANVSRKGSVNFLNIPRDNAYRNCFIANEDEVIETDDFSGCELRIWADISKDPHLTEAFMKGIDVHCYVASKLFKKEVTKKDPERTPAKSLNFGIAYGMGPYTLYENLNAQGYSISFDGAKKLFYTYNNDFSVGIKFLRDSGRLALRQGYLENRGHRRRHWILPDPENLAKYPKGTDDPKYLGTRSAIEREGGNFMIQSTNADITKYAMTLIRDYKKKHKIRTEFVNQVYDEIVTRTHKDDSPDFHAVKKRLMIQAAETFLERVPMEVDSHVGPCWQK